MPQHVTVGIVGGGVAGLALAKMLEMLGISYILYEGYHTIAPNAGASLGLMPSGLRIFDQLGVLDKIEAFAVDHDRWEHRDGESGSLYRRTSVMSNYPALFGYGAFFMARQDVLKILFDSLEDKTPVYASKRVSSVRDLGDLAMVEAADGDSFTCDLVAGADGVRSIVREAIHAQTASPPLNYLRASTTCVFGMSNPLPQITAGQFFAIYRRKVSALVFAGLNGKLYWFLFKELDEPLGYGPQRKFTDADIHTVYTEIADAVVTDGVRISDVFARREVAVMTALEEGVGEAWFCRRLFLLGDSAHKMVPHAAMGANQAMESAACFVNILRRVNPSLGKEYCSNLRASEVEKCLSSYAAKRKDTLKAVVQASTASRNNQLMAGSAAEDFLRTFPDIREEDILLKPLRSLIGAERLDNWMCGSERVEKYTEASGKALAILNSGGSLADCGLYVHLSKGI